MEKQYTGTTAHPVLGHADFAILYYGCTTVLALEMPRGGPRWPSLKSRCEVKVASLRSVTTRDNSSYPSIANRGAAAVQLTTRLQLCIAFLSINISKRISYICDAWADTAVVLMNFDDTTIVWKLVRAFLLVVRVALIFLGYLITYVELSARWYILLRAIGL